MQLFAGGQYLDSLQDACERQVLFLLQGDQGPYALDEHASAHRLKLAVEQGDRRERDAVLARKQNVIRKWHFDRERRPDPRPDLHMAEYHVVRHRGRILRWRRFVDEEGLERPPLANGHV